MRVILYIAGVLCLGIMVCQLATIATGWRWGFTHEVWRTDATAGHHSNRGAVMRDGGMRIFFESEQHPVPPKGRIWWSDLNRVDPAGSPPQFTVFNVSTVRDWRLGQTGYEYGVKADDWQGQYHLVSIDPLMLFAICAAVAFFAARRSAASIRERNREMQGRCATCGYDLRGGHDRCPECGTPTVFRGIRTEASE